MSAAVEPKHSRAWEALAEARRFVLSLTRLLLWVVPLLLARGFWGLWPPDPELWPASFSATVWLLFAAACGVHGLWWCLHRRLSALGDVWSNEGQRFDTRVLLCSQATTLVESLVSFALVTMLFVFVIHGDDRISSVLYLLAVGAQGLLTWSVGYGHWVALRSAQALRALNDDQAHRAEALISGLARSKVLGGPTRAALLTLLALARLQQSAVRDALEDLAAARHGGFRDAEVLEAGIRLGLGDPQMARAVLAERQPTSVIEIARLENLRLSLALQEGRGHEVVAEIPELLQRAKERPARWQVGLGFVAAAVYEQTGQRELGLNLLAELPSPESWAWLRASNPRLWNALCRLRGLPESATAQDSALRSFQAILKRDARERFFAWLPLESVRFLGPRGLRALLPILAGLLVLGLAAALAGGLAFRSWLRGSQYGPWAFAGLCGIGVLSLLGQLARWWMRNFDSGGHDDSIAFDDGSRMSAGVFMAWQWLGHGAAVVLLALLLPLLVWSFGGWLRLGILSVCLAVLLLAVRALARRLRLPRVLSRLARGRLREAAQTLEAALAASQGPRHRTARHQLWLLQGWLQMRQSEPQQALQTWQQIELPSKAPKLQLRVDTCPDIARVLCGWLWVARDIERARNVHASAPSFGVGEIFRRELLGALLALHDGRAEELLGRADWFAELGPRLATHERALLDLVWAALCLQAGAERPPLLQEGRDRLAVLRLDQVQLAWAQVAFPFLDLPHSDGPAEPLHQVCP